MRFRRLELIRYGGFADRVFDFGEPGDGTDLHLVVGPNEAGKSTALQAIGDLLFGIPGQTGQNWRYDYGQLRIRALIEHGGALLDVTRRKGNRDTLLRADGTPFAVDPLAALLGGVDRAAFERMFGLDHSKLRAGGEGILHNREDSARITLEAGTGLSHIGRELAGLTKIATDLFKPGGQNPPVNQLMRERSDALADVRRTSISDADWSAVRQRRARAEERRSELIDEASALDREIGRLDRLGRARAPLARLVKARAERAALGDVPDLPIDATARLTSARAERDTVNEVLGKARADLARIDNLIATVPLSTRILSARNAIQALDERRPVIVKALVDVERRRAELERIDSRLAAARLEARLSEGSGLPTAGWRKRVAAHLEGWRDIRMREQGSGRERAQIDRLLGEAKRELAAMGEVPDPQGLTVALARLPDDFGERLAGARSEAERWAERAADLMVDLAPWQGTAASLQGLELPSPADAGEARRAVEQSSADEVAARREAEAADKTIIRDSARLARLETGDGLPTAEAVAAARVRRDQLVSAIEAAHRADLDGELAAAIRDLPEAIANADGLVDRREIEAARVAEHGLLSTSIAEATALAAAARRREDTHGVERRQQQADWDTKLLALGFERTILPVDWTAWLSTRTSALAAVRERDGAARHLAALIDAEGQARHGIADALVALGECGLQPDDPDLVARADRLAGILAARMMRRDRLLEEVARSEETLAGIIEVAEEIATSREHLVLERSSLATEAGLPPASDEAALIDAVEAVTQVAEDAAMREGIVRQIAGIERDGAVFERDLAAALELIEEEREGSAADQVRALASTLRVAIGHEDMLARHRDEQERVEGELETVERRQRVVEATIAELIALAGVSDEAALDRVITDSGTAAQLAQAERDALDELAGADNGQGLDALAAEIEALPFENQVAMHAGIEDRRREMAGEREEVGRALHAAEEEIARAAGESAAAEAQQRASDASAALAQAAEEHVSAAAAAALLGWILDRHRATNQAPLIARASALFAQVTNGAFSRLAIGYDEQDRAIIQAVRRDGSAVGVEALSEGTRDQLYLALRLGSIEGRSAAGTLPIICDDLLITADDARSAALLGVLSSASMHSQTIIFSHHEHLVGIAEESIGSANFRLHRIEPSTRPQAA